MFKILALVLLATCQLASADEFDSLLDSIKADYHSGRYQQALDSLHKAETSLLEARLSLLNAAIPKAIAGWQQVEIENEADQTGLAGSVQKEFIQKAKKVRFIIGPDQPLIAATLHLTGQPGEKIKDVPALVFYDDKTQQGQIGLTPTPSLIVVVKGEGISKRELLDLAGQLKLDILSSFK